MAVQDKKKNREEIERVKRELRKAARVIIVGDGETIKDDLASIYSIADSAKIDFREIEDSPLLTLIWIIGYLKEEGQANLSELPLLSGEDEQRLLMQFENFAHDVAELVL